MQLETNSFLYETLLRYVRVLQGKTAGHLLSGVERVARVAWHNHAGRFADGALENLPYQAGLQLEGTGALPGAYVNGVARRCGSRTLHVASEIYSTGGHSRVLTKWIQRDCSCAHAIVLTRQHHAVPEFLQRILEERGAAVTLLRAVDPIETRARQVRSLASGFDRVILHTSPDDPVPVLAFAQPGGCPVAMFNHAHFWFCLGSSVSDIIINTLPYFQGISERYRFARATALLTGPTGLLPLKPGALDKSAARVALGLSPRDPVVMTIAEEHYYRPGFGYDFFQTAGKLMKLHPDLTLLVVGVPETSRLVPGCLKSSGRIRLLGPVVDPTPIYLAADVCLESFPMPSLGAVMESVAYGEAFPVPVYGPGENVVRVNLKPMLDYEFRPRTEDEYLAYVGKLLASRDETRERAAGLRKALIEWDERFGEQFPALYRQIDSLKHRTSEIPATCCGTDEDHRILASFTCPDVGREIDHLLPFQAAVAAHVKAALLGHEEKRLAAMRIKGRSLGGFGRLGSRARNYMARGRC